MTISSLTQRKSTLTLALIIIAVVLLASAATFADWLNNQRFEQQQRLLVQNELAAIRARLEGNLNTDFEVLRGLQAVISLEPELSQARFSELARQILTGHHQLRNIGAAPDLVLRYIYPLVGNEAVLGMDYRDMPGQWEAIARARDSGLLTVAGPLQLAQGGSALIGRIPVYSKTASGEETFWGMLSAVIDLDRFYEASELNAGSALQVAIRGRDGLVDDAEVFYGDADVFAQNPVIARVALPIGAWEVGALPQGGWPHTAPNAWLLRLLVSVALALFIAAGIVVVRLSRIRELQQARLHSLFDMSPVGIALNDYGSGDFLEMNDMLIGPTGYSRDELLQLSLWALTPHSYKEQEIRLRKALRECGHFGPYEKEFIRKNGSRYPVKLNSVLVDDASGRKCIWSIVEDLSLRHETQRALTESRVHLQRFFDVSTNLMCIFSRSGKFELFNNAFSRLLGYSPDVVQAAHFLNFVHPEDFDEVGAELDYILQENTSTSFVCRYQRESGDFVYLNWTASIDPGTGNIYAAAMDVTRQRAHENRLAQQQDMLESMSKLARIGAWEINLRDNVVVWSEMARVIHEVDINFEPRMDSVLSFYRPGKSQVAMEQAIQLCSERGQAFSEEVQIITAKDHNLWVLVTGKAEMHDGRCVRISGSYQDINARKLIEQNMERTQQELQQQMRMLKLIAESQAHFIAQANVDSALQDFLQNMLSLAQSRFGFIAEMDYENSMPYLHRWYFAGGDGRQADNRQHSELLAYQTLLATPLQSLQPVVETAVQQHWQLSGSPPVSLTIDNYLAVPVIHDSRGIALVVLANRLGGFSADLVDWLSPLMNTAGQFVHSARGVHAREKAEQEMRAAKDAAEQAANAKSDFLAMMSHEIRTPLNGVMGMLSLLNRSDLTDDQRRKLTIATHSSNTLLNIINDILDFSKVDAGKIELESLDFDLIAQLEEFAESMALRAQEKGLELILDTTAIAQPMVCGDPGRIRQILNNLVGNAIKFTSDGDVLVRCSLSDVSPGLEFRVAVVDTGIGIAEQKLDELFNPFTQVDASTTREYGGTGLGLAICKKLCGLMQGDITVHSVLGRGSVFEFHVQLQASTKSLPLPQIDLHGRRIFVADDNRQVTELVCQWLQTWGAEVYSAADGETALARAKVLAEERPVDVILLDDKLPVSAESDLGQALRVASGDASTPLLLMTRIAGGERHAANRSVGSVTKPLSRAALVSALSRLLSGCQPDLPARPDKGVERAPDASVVPVRDQLSGRVLLVEDNPVNQAVARMMLDELGLVVTTAGNGIEALEALQLALAWDHYAVVLMDCQMPLMDGYETSRRIRQGAAGERYRTIPIVAMTANAMKGDKEQCLAAGMDDYISKPIDPQVLDSKVRAWLASTANNARAEAATVQEVVMKENPSAAETIHDRWDYDAMLASLKNREDRVNLLLKAFCGRLPETLEEFKLAREHNDFEKIGFIAHSIKGSAAQLHAYRLQNISANLEKDVKTSEYAQVPALSDAMYFESRALLAQLQTHLGG